MSQYYDMGDQTLWNPAPGVSRLFMSQVRVHEAEVGVPSGIGPMQDDECQVDPTGLKSFTDALLAWHRGTSHPVVAALSEGFVVTVLALADRAGVTVNWYPTDGAGNSPAGVQASANPDPSEEVWAARLQMKSHNLARFMAR